MLFGSRAIPPTPAITTPNVRLRAERRTGELLKELAREQTAGLKQGPLSNDAITGLSPFAAALADTGMSRQTAHRYQQLADIPSDDFEAALALLAGPPA